MVKISSIVVTFNKVDFLKENIASLLSQTQKIEHILIIDNASTDGTEAYVQSIKNKHPEIIYHKLEKNIGGAGGFNYGLKKVYQIETDYVWIMDDDTIPEKNAAEELLKVASVSNFSWGFLSSDVRWTDGTPCLMNMQQPSRIWSNNIDQGLVQVNSATFVSLFIRKETIKEVGLPIKEFFLWSDDIEYTTRISNKRPSYFVSSSKVIHKMGANTDTNIFEEKDKNRVPRYFFSFRNKLFLEKKNSRLGFLRYLLSLNISVLKVLFSSTPYKMEKIKVIYKGMFAGMLFNPSIEHVE